MQNKSEASSSKIHEFFFDDKVKGAGVLGPQGPPEHGSTLP